MITDRIGLHSVLLPLLNVKFCFFECKNKVNLTSLAKATDGLMSPSNTPMKERRGVTRTKNRVKVVLIHKNFVTRKFLQMTPACMCACNWNYRLLNIKIWKRRNQWGRLSSSINKPELLFDNDCTTIFIWFFLFIAVTIFSFYSVKIFPDNYILL